MMDQEYDSTDAIVIEEIHHYEVELSEYAYMKWEKGNGSIKIKIPYDGNIFPLDGPPPDEMMVGNLKIKLPSTSDTESSAYEETLAVKIEAGEKWLTHIKSGKRAVFTAEYPISDPDDTVLTIEGKVLDYTPNDFGVAKNGYENRSSFQNALKLDFEFWFPDFFHIDEEAELEEVERMILQRENVGRVFIRYHDVDDTLAESMVALANRFGGTIFIGVKQNGELENLSQKQLDKLPVKILNSALSTNVPVPIKRANKFTIKSKQFYALTIETTPNCTFGVNGKVYKRQKNETVEVKGVKPTAVDDRRFELQHSIETLLEQDEKGLRAIRNTDKVSVLSAQDEDLPGALGKSLCGLINADLDTAVILVTDLEELGTVQHELVKQKFILMLREITPKIDTYTIEKKNINDETISVIQLPIKHIPVALYKEQAYLWIDKDIREITTESLLDHYVNLKELTIKSNYSLVKAVVNWPVAQPDSATLFKLKNVNGVAHNFQHQVLHWNPVDDWNPKPVSRDSGTLAGYKARLSLPLDNVAISTGEPGVIDNELPELEGEFEFLIDDMVFSDIQVDPFIEEESFDDQDNLEEREVTFLQNLPIKKQTRLIFKVRADLREIFRHRRQTQTTMRFSVRDADIQTHAEDIIQICADCGFRVYQFPMEASGNEVWLDWPAELVVYSRDFLEASGKYFIKHGVIRGLRSSKYHDISLFVFLTSKPTVNVREMRFEDVKDVSETVEYNLSVEITLTGQGEGTNREIAQLQLQLYELLNQRLQRIGVE